MYAQMGGVVKTGKESSVYFAPAVEEASSGCAVKIFKTSLAEFGNRWGCVEVFMCERVCLGETERERECWLTAGLQ